MKTFTKALFMVAIAIVVGVGVAYAVSYDWYKATGNTDDDTTYTQLEKDEIHFTSGADMIRMGPGADYVYMAADDDEINMGGGDDTLTFHAQSGDTETIAFDENKTTYIKYTESDDTIEIKSDSGDVIITLGD